MFHNKKIVKKNKREFLWVLFGAYCIALFFILFVRRKFEIWLPYWEEVKMSINLVPFRSIRGNVFYIIEGTDRYMIRHSVINLLGNIALFMPYGFCVPRLFERFRRFGMFVLLSLGILLSAETIQVLTLRGSFDIDDIILNMLGAVIGFSLSKKRVSNEQSTRPK